MNGAFRVLVGAIGAVVAVASAVPAQAGVRVEVRRLAGADRYETAAAAALSTKAGATGGTVVIASGADYADALAGGELGGFGGVLLLTERDRLPAATANALSRIEPADVIVLGGTGAVSARVMDELEQGRWSVKRIAGADRYGTAAAAYEQDLDTDGRPNSFAVLVSGETFADAIAASGVLRFRSLLLTRRDSLPAETERVLRAHVAEVIIVGGTTAVSAQVEDAVTRVCRPPRDGIEDCVAVRRVAGSNRQGTAVALARDGLPPTQPHTVELVRGDAFPDALAAGVHTKATSGVVLLTRTPNDLSAETRAFLRERRGSIEVIDVFGSSAAVSDDVAEDARRAATATS